MFSSLGNHHESLLSPTMLLELSDVVFGWMSELKSWTGRGNVNAEFDADGHVERNTNFEMAMACIQPGTVVFVETSELGAWCAERAYARAG